MSNAKPTIVYIHPHFTIEGGAGKYALKTAQELKRRGFKVVIVCCKADPAIISEYRESLQFYTFGGPISSKLGFWIRFPFSAFQIFRFIKRFSNVIVFAQVFPANWFGFLIKIFSRSTPVVWMCQEPSAFIHSEAWIQALTPGLMKNIVQNANPILKPLDTYLATFADKIIVNSKFTASYTSRVYGVEPKLLSISYPALSHTDFFAVETKKKQQIVTVCRLTKFKNIDRIIHAVKLLKGQGIDLELAIVGKGEEEQVLKQLCIALNLTQQVHFRGALSTENLRKVIQDSRAFVLASVEEPFGIVALEAMACGTPVIASAFGGPSETVVVNETGYLLQEMNAESIAVAIRQLLIDENLFERMRKASIQRAQAFTWEKSTDVIESVFNQLDSRN